MYRIDFSAIRVPPGAANRLRDCLAQEAIGQSGYLQEFERMVAGLVGAQHCVAVTNGTLADAVACAAMREKYGVKRAILPALTFVAQANAVRMAGLEVEFVDVTADWTIDLARLELGNKEMLFLTHILGRAAPVETLDHQFIEDTCEAFGSRLNGKYLGTFGAMGTFSFFISHTVTTGEGGAIVTDDDDLAQLCRQLRSHGRASETDARRKFSFPYFGFNAKMSGLTAAFGVSVLEHTRQYLLERRRVFAKLNHALGGGFTERPGEQAIPHAYPVGFLNETARNRAMDNLLAAGIECRRFFSSVPSEPAWGGKTGQFPMAEYISRTHLLVPCHHNLTETDVDWLAGKVLEQDGLCSPSFSSPAAQPLLA